MENKYCLQIRSNFMRYADQYVGNGNYHAYAEGCFESGKKWRIEAHTGRFFLYVGNHLYYREALDDNLEHTRYYTSPGIFYKYANRLLERYEAGYNDPVIVKNCETNLDTDETI